MQLVSSSSQWRVLGLLLAVVFLVEPSARAMDITTCGAIVPRGETGVLQADLQCGSPDPSSSCSTFPPPSSFGVRLSLGSILAMNGHSISGAVVGVQCFDPSTQLDGCEIDGPGEISGNNCGVLPGNARQRPVTVRNLYVHDNNQQGVAGRKVLATELTVSGNPGDGIEALRLTATNVTANNNGVGLDVLQHTTGANVTASNNTYIGVSSIRCRLQGLVAQNNGLGVLAERLTLRDSVVTGNGSADLKTGFHPRLINTTCEHSYQEIYGYPWGVCSQDFATTTSTTSSTTTTTGP